MPKGIGYKGAKKLGKIPRKPTQKVADSIAGGGGMHQMGKAKKTKKPKRPTGLKVKGK